MKFMIPKVVPRGTKENAKHTAAGIPTWSPTVVLICRSTVYVWQSGRDAQFSADYCRNQIVHINLKLVRHDITASLWA
ncbi:hypothetical protein KCU65_g8457, partial [Aureobasidium melanogenum]